MLLSPELFENLSCFVSCKRRPLNISPHSLPFFNEKSSGKSQKKLTKVLWGAGKVTKQATICRSLWAFAGLPARSGKNLSGETRGTRLIGGTRLVVFPRPNRSQFEKATGPDPLSSLDPLPLAPCPFPKICQGGGPGRKGGVPARRGVGVPARGVLRPVRGQEAWEYHEPGPPNEPGPLAFPQKSLKSSKKSQKAPEMSLWRLFELLKTSLTGRLSWVLGLEDLETPVNGCLVAKPTATNESSRETRLRSALRK